MKKEIIAALFAVALVGCASNKVASGSPDWVNKGQGAFEDNNLYGVGMATGVQNRALAVDTADNRARAKIAEVLNASVEKMTRDYMASTTAGDMKKSSEEQDVRAGLKTFVQTTLTGVVITDHWRDTSDGTVFALAKLDPKSFKSWIETSKELNSQVRDFVRANADKYFQEMEKESEKRGGK